MADPSLTTGIEALRQRLEQLQADAAARPAELTAALPGFLADVAQRLEELRPHAERLEAANRDVQARHDYYERLFNLAPDGHLVTDADGVIREANRAAGALLGVDAPALRGRSFAHFVAEPGREPFRSDMLALAGQPDVDLLREWRVRLQPLRGEPFDGALTVTVLRHPPDRPALLHWSLRNITRRRELEESLRKSEARLRAILDTAFNAVLLINEQGVIESANPAAERMFGYAASEILGRDFTALWPPATSPEGGGANQLTLAEAVPHGLVRELTGRRKDGTAFPVEVAVSEVRLDDRRFFTVIARDLTDRRRAEDALREREEQFRSLVEAAECMIVILRPDLTVAYFSPFAERLTGYAVAEVLGKNYAEVFVAEPETREAIGEAVRRALSGSPTQQFEHAVCCKHGHCRQVIWNAQRLANYAGSGAVLAVGLDITRLKEAQERVLQAERLAAIGQMVAGLAHRVSGQPEAESLIANIQRAQDHLYHLYDEVRGYAAPVRLEPRACNLAEVWREAWADLEPRRQGRQASLREAPDCIEVRCVVDPFRLGQVFRNVFQNALDACADPVEVEVYCSEDEIDGRPAVRVALADNGPGLTPEQRERIFEPFYTTKTKGTGLGMAIARRVVEAHGGRIEAGGRQRGTQIVITLPWRKQ